MNRPVRDFCPQCSTFQRRISQCVLLALLAAGLAPAAAAQEAQPRWLVSAIGGFGALSDTDLSGDLGVRGDVDFDLGFAAGASLEYQWGAWRLGGEYLYQTNDADRLRVSGLAAAADGGDFASVAVSLNVSRAFELLPSSRAQSYLGAGVVWLQEVDIDFDTESGERSFSSDDTGFQLFAGVRYRLAPRWQLGLELRYLDAGSLALDGEGAASGSVNADYARTSVLGSLGYRF